MSAERVSRATRHGALRWVLVPDAQRAATGALVQLDAEKLKHLRKVLRMEWDEELRVIDGAGRLFEARLEKISDRGGVRLGALLREETEPPACELVLGLPKNTTTDWVMEKAVECGVTHVTPVVSSRSVVRPDSSSNDDKYVRRWQAIIDSAVEQSERLWRPIVRSPVPWKQWSGDRADVASFVFVSELRNELSDEQALTTAWRALRAVQGQPVRLLIGPEGGLTEDEREELRQAGFVELSLGTIVLRVETAAVAALMLLRVSRFVSSS